MKITPVATVFALLFSATTRAEVTCTKEQLEPVFMKARAHFKLVEKADISLSSSFRQAHDIQPPNGPTAISSLLFDKTTGVLKYDTARNLWVVQTGQRPVVITTEQINALKDDFDQTLASAPSGMHLALTKLKESGFKNVAEFDANLRSHVLDLDAPFVGGFGLEVRLRSAKTCTDFQSTLDTYFDAADLLISQQSQRFNGTRNLDTKMPFNGGGISMAESLGEVCAKTGITRLGYWKKAFALADRKGGSVDAAAQLWAEYFLMSSTTNWRDQWALLLGMIDKMLIKSKNQAAVKALVAYDFSAKDASTDRLNAKISELCPDLLVTERAMMANILAIDKVLLDWTDAKFPSDE